MEEEYKDPGFFRPEVVSSASQVGAITDEHPDQNSELEMLKKRVDEYWEKCNLLYLSIGHDLLTAKSFFREHGEWLKWLKASVPFSVRQAQRLMRVAEWFGETTPGSHLDFTKAYILTRIPKPKVNDFLKQYQTTGADVEPLSVIQAMSKRELEDAIREYLRATVSVSRTHKEGKAKVDSPAALSADSALDELCRLETAMFGLVENIVNRRIDNEEYDAVISEIRRLCEDTLGKLPLGDVEIE